MRTLLNIFFSIYIITCFAQNAHASVKSVPENKSEVVLSYAPLVKKTAPAVVNIYTKKKVTVRSGFSPFFNDPLFNHFFGNNPIVGNNIERIESSLGSGVIIKSDGHIVTSNHVIEGSDDITIILSDRREYEAKILIQDKKTDLALLKIDTEGEQLPFIELMNSDELEVGDIVVAIGNPFGVGQTVTSGIVSAVARAAIGISDYQFFIQTDAAINPGNSGGALVNMQGKLAGLNTAIFTKSGGSDGIGFAIPSNMVATIINKTNNKEGKIIRPWLGIKIEDVTADMAKSLNLSNPQGGIISSIHDFSPAKEAGLKLGDIIIAANGHKITDKQSLLYRIATYDLNSQVTFDILTNGIKKQIKVKMIAPPDKPKRDPITISGNNPLSGVTCSNISPALIEEMNLDFATNGVVITQITGGAAAQLGLTVNDIIKSINNTNIASTSELEKTLKSEARGWQIVIQRGDRLLNINWNIR
jgi:Do/DeqQ family serine protease